MKKKEFQINSLSDLINKCIVEKEIQLKYDLETNVNLVSFEEQKVEISFNE